MPTASSSTTCEALSAAKASASQPPVRCRVAMYKTLMRCGRCRQAAVFGPAAGAISESVALIGSPNVLLTLRVRNSLPRSVRSTACHASQQTLRGGTLARLARQVKLGSCLPRETCHNASYGKNRISRLQ